MVKQAEKDSIIYFGFVKQVEIIGEAVYMLAKEFRIAHPEVEWEAIEGMRRLRRTFPPSNKRLNFIFLQ